jgi:hypothetical protein
MAAWALALEPELAPPAAARALGPARAVAVARAVALAVDLPEARAAVDPAAAARVAECA